MPDEALKSEIKNNPRTRVDTDSIAAGAGYISVEARRHDVTAFRQLRIEVQRTMRTELMERIAHNPTPTPAEQALGAYEEALEPQIRAAVMAARQKGYDTYSSGFDGPVESDIQELQFSSPEPLSTPTLDRIFDSGAGIVDQGNFYEITFVPATTELAYITTQWDTIIGHLPDLGKPAPSIQGHFTDRAFVINALNVGVTANEMSASPFATELAIQEGMAHMRIEDPAESRPLVKFS